MTPMAPGPLLDSTLGLMQLGDSLFPSGAFVHSYGLEQLARDGSVRGADGMLTFVRSVLHQALATADAPACHRATRDTWAGDLDALLSGDRALYRTKAAEELRTAALNTGRRQLEEVLDYLDNPTLAAYAKQVRADRSLGMQPVVFGAISAAMGVLPELGAGAFLLGAVNGMLQASMRLLAVSHRDVQAALHLLRPEIAAISASISNTLPQPLRAFHPMQEIASMRHADATARLFAS